MLNYDFHGLLEPMEFEKFVCDIIQIREGIPVETYKDGKDGGIDGLFIDKNKKTVIQAKRYKQDFNVLYRNLRNELEKVRKIKPDRYILGISMEFGRNQKMKIMNLFEGYIKDINDILSKQDMNRLLEEEPYKWVELKYHKLWLTSMNVFTETLNKSINRPLYIESELEFQKAIEISNVFVSTKKYQEVLKMSLDNQVVIISGEPGVGKTTMAYLLALAHLKADDLNGFIWANSIKDIYLMLETDKKQIFILDDFWGSIFHDEYANRNSENQLNTLINYIRSLKGEKLLILTTREYVLQQGLRKHPLLRETIEHFSLICTVDDYTYEEKANILYKHLYASQLKYDYVKLIYYRSTEIVFANNYNPRVLKLYLEKEQPTNISPEEYDEDFLFYLDNPTLYWEEIFIELTMEAKIISLLLLITSASMSITELKKCFNKYIYNSNNKIEIRNIEKYIAELEKTMVYSYYDENIADVIINFKNPAAHDFLYEILRVNSEQYVPLIIDSCCYYNQLLYLLEHVSMKCSKIIEEEILGQCISFYDEYEFSYSDGYLEWDVDEYGTLNKIFHLLRCGDVTSQSTLFNFIQNKLMDYCQTMGNNERIEDQYIDLHNLPSIIVDCVNNGMSFNGTELIEKYYQEAFSVYHYKAIQSLQEVFPSEYESFNHRYSETIKQSIKQIILEELNFLEEFGMEFHFDMFLDSIPGNLEKFGQQYTKEFEEEIYDFYGRIPFKSKAMKNENEFNEDVYIGEEERDFYEVKWRAYDWLFGRTEIEIEEKDHIRDIVSRSNINTVLKKELNEVIETSEPYFIYQMLETNISVYLFLDMLTDKNSSIPKTECELSLSVLRHISQGNQDLIYDIIYFFAETFVLIVDQEEPILGTNDFFSSEVYTRYLKNNEPLKELLFEYFILNDGRWVRFNQIHFFIFCFAMIVTIEDIENNEIEKSFRFLFSGNFDKLKLITKTEDGYEEQVGYADYASYFVKRDDWEGLLYRMFYELIPYKFIQSHIEPTLRGFLEEICGDESKNKVLKYLENTRLTYEFDQSGEQVRSTYMISQELCMIEHLKIAETPHEFIEYLDQQQFEELKRKGYFKKENKNWKIELYEIDNVDVLIELGIYSEVLDFLNKIEDVYSIFKDRTLF